MSSDESADSAPHEEMDPEDWFDILEGGDVAVHLHLSADNEWWMAHDPDGEYPHDLDGPWQLWTTYPSGAWDHTALSRGIMAHHLDELYWEGVPEDRDSDIYRSKVVPIEDAPEFVQAKVGGEARD